MFLFSDDFFMMTSFDGLYFKRVSGDEVQITALSNGCALRTALLAKRSYKG